MKKMVQRMLIGIIIIVMLLSLLFNYFLQVDAAERDMDYASQQLFWQIDQILLQNQTELEQVAAEFKQQCLLQAKAAAYIVQHRPMILDDQEELKKVVAYLQIDELHAFNAEGVIVAGSEPKYFGYSFHSGEQMQFFLPMLEDRDLALCQDITPNTAEGKLMQYAAVWREDGKGIVQIGMEPARVLEATRKNELSYIFTLLTADEGAVLFAIDPQTYEILGSTKNQSVGKNLSDLGITPDQVSVTGKGFYVNVDGQPSYCIFSESDSVILGRICSVDSLYKNVNENCFILALYLLAISVIMIYAISRYLDKNIIRSIFAVNQKLQKIADGDLDENFDVQTTPEFVELSGHINQMVQSLLETTDNLSSVLDIAKVPIGVYEYSRGMERVRITSRVPEILALSEDEKKRLLSNYTLFEKKLVEIRQHPIHAEESIYQLSQQPAQYIKLESFQKGNSTFGILLDVTKDIQEKQQIKQERDEDALTGLYSRRAFYNDMDQLFAQPEQLKHAVMIMIDSDNLKQVNDCHGHEKGDRYLCEIADLLRSGTAPQQIVARLSGDEFVVFIYGCDSRSLLEIYIEELRQKQAGHAISFAEQFCLPIAFSMGCAYYLEDGKDYHVLMKCADTRMYDEKRFKKQRIISDLN